MGVGFLLGGGDEKILKLDSVMVTSSNHLYTLCGRTLQYVIFNSIKCLKNKKIVTHQILAG